MSGPSNQEFLSLLGLSVLVLCLQVTPGAYPGAPIGLAPVVLANIGLGWRGLPGTA